MNRSCSGTRYTAGRTGPKREAIVSYRAINSSERGLEAGHRTSLERRLNITALPTVIAMKNNNNNDGRLSYRRPSSQSAGSGEAVRTAESSMAASRAQPEQASSPGEEGCVVLTYSAVARDRQLPPHQLTMAREQVFVADLLFRKTGSLHE